MRFFTDEELKDILQISLKQAKALMRTDGFPSIRIGRSYRVKEEDFLTWLSQTKSVKLDYSKC